MSLTVVPYFLGKCFVVTHLFLVSGILFMYNRKLEYEFFDLLLVWIKSMLSNAMQLCDCYLCKLINHCQKLQNAMDADEKKHDGTS